MSYKEMARRLEELERRHEAQQADAGLSTWLEALDPDTRKAIEGLSPVDRQRWITGMEWFGSLPDENNTQKEYER